MKFTDNRRVQTILQLADSHGWQVDASMDVANMEVPNWLVTPHGDREDGFVVYALDKSKAKVLRGNDFKPMTQAAAKALIEVHPVASRVESASPLDATAEVRTVDLGDGVVEFVTEFSIPDALSDKDKAEFCEGAMLASTKIAGLIEQSVDTSRTIFENNPEVFGTGVTATQAAHGWLQLSNDLRDPRTKRLILDGRSDVSLALDSGVNVVVAGLIGIWTAFAENLFRVDQDAVCALSDYFESVREHANFLRTSADETFGEGLHLSDSDLEGLLS